MQPLQLALSRWLTGPRDELGVQHFAFTQLRFHIHARIGEHVAQAFKATGESAGRQFEKEVGMALAGSRIDLTSVTLHVGHQIIGGGKAFTAEKQQVFQKMRHARPFAGHVVTASRDAQNRRTAFEPWLMAH